MISTGLEYYNDVLCSFRGCVEFYSVNLSSQVVLHTWFSDSNIRFHRPNFLCASSSALNELYTQQGYLSNLPSFQQTLCASKPARASGNWWPWRSPVNPIHYARCHKYWPFSRKVFHWKAKNELYFFPAAYFFQFLVTSGSPSTVMNNPYRSSFEVIQRRFFWEPGTLNPHWQQIPMKTMKLLHSQVVTLPDEMRRLPNYPQPLFVKQCWEFLTHNHSSSLWRLSAILRQNSKAKGIPALIGKFHCTESNFSRPQFSSFPMQFWPFPDSNLLGNLQFSSFQYQTLAVLRFAFHLRPLCNQL